MVSMLCTLDCDITPVMPQYVGANCIRAHLITSYLCYLNLMILVFNKQVFLVQMQNMTWDQWLARCIQPR